MAYRDLRKDPRYPAFVERYQFDPLAFVMEACLMVPSDDQAEACDALVSPRAKVSIVSGTGTGKTSLFGRLALWHLLCYPDNPPDANGIRKVGSNTYIGAPRLNQVADGVWKEMSDARIAMLSGPHAWICEYFTIKAERVWVHGYKDQWYITKFAMQAGKAVGIAGKHRYWQLIFIDEAAGVPDEHFSVIDGTQTEGGNRTLMASQGVKNTGRFYESHHRLSIANGGSWDALRFSSEDSPFVTDEWLADREFECGGRDSVEYQLRVLGLFAQDTSGLLLSRKDAEKLFTNGQIIKPHEPYGVVLLSDVSCGTYRDDSIVTLAKIIGNGDRGEDARRVEFYQFPVFSNSINEVDLSGEIFHLLDGASDVLAYIDADGIGHAICSAVERQGKPVTKIHWGEPCFKNEFRQRFFNQRACALVRFAQAVKEGRASITADVGMLKKNKIIEQASNLPYVFADMGIARYKIIGKETMREKYGIKSPDAIDAMAFAFLEKVVYVPRDNGAEIDEAGNESETLALPSTDQDVESFIREMSGK